MNNLVEIKHVQGGVALDHIVYIVFILKAYMYQY